MRVACLGGGPAGLYFAISLKLRNSGHEIDVIERNKADDTFGWGIVLSDETLENLHANDPLSAKAIHDYFAYWDDIALHYRGQRLISSGHGFCGIGRKKLLQILQKRAIELGVNLLFESEVVSAVDYSKSYDLVVASDGLNSKTRSEFKTHFKPNLELRKCQFVWLGTHQKFADSFTFIFEKTKHGWVWAHAYQFDKNTATFDMFEFQTIFNKIFYLDGSYFDVELNEKEIEKLLKNTEGIFEELIQLYLKKINN